MTEQDDVTAGGAPLAAGLPVSGAGSTPDPTGHPQVDQVLESLRALDDLPVDQHVAVFEGAHTGLRAALGGSADPAAAARG